MELFAKHARRLQVALVLLILAALAGVGAYGVQLPPYALEALVLALGALGVPRPSDAADAALSRAAGPRLEFVNADGTRMPVSGLKAGALDALIEFDDETPTEPQ